VQANVVEEGAKRESPGKVKASNLFPNQRRFSNEV
jgi:hypothetical protein